MSRRRAAIKRERLPDPKFASELITKFVNHVMVDGKKSIAEKVVYRALEGMAQKLKDKVKAEVNDPKDDNQIALWVFEKVLHNVAPVVEVKSRRVGGATYQIPDEVRPTRRVTLAMRWLIDSAKKRSEKNMALRLAAEMVDAYNNRGGAIKKREDTYRMAKANEAFAHYRWGGSKGREKV